uniref:Uncharacterized protein n=1 Tax=Arundo donax TaxID=35708 RepID=A0A0A9BR11_ARUDO
MAHSSSSSSNGSSVHLTNPFIPHPAPPVPIAAASVHLVNIALMFP